MSNFQKRLSPSEVQEMVKPFDTQELAVLCNDHEDKKTNLNKAYCTRNKNRSENSFRNLLAAAFRALKIATKKIRDIENLSVVMDIIYWPKRTEHMALSLC